MLDTPASAPTSRARLPSFGTSLFDVSALSAYHIGDSRPLPTFAGKLSDLLHLLLVSDVADVASQYAAIKALEVLFSLLSLDSSPTPPYVSAEAQSQYRWFPA